MQPFLLKMAVPKVSRVTVNVLLYFNNSLSSLMPTPHAPPGEKQSGDLNFLGLFPKTGEDEWDCEIANYYVVLSLQQSNFFISIRVSMLFLSFPQNI